MSFFSRTNLSGWRWQERHHSICKDDAWYIKGIVLTLPWQVEQPTPLLM
jgi:hypothetical protein